MTYGIFVYFLLVRIKKDFNVITRVYFLLIFSYTVNSRYNITNPEGTQKKVRYIESSLYRKFSKKIFQWETPLHMSGNRRQDRNANNSSFLSITLKLH